MTKTEFETLESNLQYSLDEIYSILEKIKINEGLFNNTSKVEFLLDRISNKLQDIDQQHQSSSKIFVTKVTYLLLKWFRAVNPSQSITYLPHNNLAQISLPPAFINVKLGIGASMASLIQKLTQLDEVCQKYNNQSSSNCIAEVEQMEKVVSAVNTNFNQNTIITSYEPLTHNDRNIMSPVTRIGIQHNYIPAYNFNIETEWNIDVLVKDPSLEKEFLIMSILTSILSQDNENIVTLESIEIGSLITRIKVKFLNFLARDKTKKVVNDTVDELKAYASKQGTENKKTISETDKNRIETEQKKKELDAETKKELRERKALERRILKAQAEQEEEEVKSKKLDNALKQVELFKKQHELLTAGILEIDEVGIIIDGQVVISKIGDNISGKRIE